MDRAILIEVESLRRASVTLLRKKHLDLFGEESTSRNREQLFRRIAWRMHAVAEGDLSDRARARAAEIANDADLRIIAPRNFFSVEGTTVQTAPSDRRGGDHDSRLPIPGTLLKRKWKDRTILVEVLKTGFRYNNHHYSSLSAVASAANGTRWNGIAFFGLTRSATATSAEVADA